MVSRAQGHRESSWAVRAAPLPAERAGCIVSDLAGSLRRRRDMRRDLDGVPRRVAPERFAWPGPRRRFPAESWHGASAIVRRTVSCPSGDASGACRQDSTVVRAIVGRRRNVGNQRGTMADQSGNGANAALPTLARQPELVQGALSTDCRVLALHGGSVVGWLDVFATTKRVHDIHRGRKRQVGTESIIMGAVETPTNQQSVAVGEKRHRRLCCRGTGKRACRSSHKPRKISCAHALLVGMMGKMMVFRDGWWGRSHQFVTPDRGRSRGWPHSSRASLEGDIGE